MYKNLEIEEMQLLKSTTVPVIVGALGIIQKGIYKHINKIPGSVILYEMQKIAFHIRWHYQCGRRTSFI